MSVQIADAGDMDKITTQGKPLVRSDGHIEFVVEDAGDEVVLARISAEFDISQVPPQFAGMALSLLQQQRSKVFVGAMLRGGEYPIIERRHRERTPAVPPQASSWWGRLAEKPFVRWLLAHDPFVRWLLFRGVPRG